MRKIRVALLVVIVAVGVGGYAALSNYTALGGSLTVFVLP